MSKQVQTKIKVKEFPIDGIDEASYNPRHMTDEARQGLEEALEDYGVMRLPVVNERHDPPRLVSGHQLVTSLKRQGYTHVECAVVRFDDADEKAANLALNNRAIRGSYHPKAAVALDKLRKKLPNPNRARFEHALSDVRKAAARFKAEHGSKASADTDPAETEVHSEVGVVYELGDHRLYCGDFRDALDVLLSDYYANACVTDPPYNLAYTSGKSFRKDKLREPIEGDDQEPEAWSEFVDALASGLLDSVSGPMYVFMSAQELPSLEAAWTRHKGVVHRWLVVAKSAHPLSPGDYHPQYELCLYGARSDAGELPYYGKPQTNVFEVARPGKNPLHPAQKTIELIRQFVENSTEVEEVVLDPFAGSGTTLAVCEELARVCMAAEISPGHCDTIRRRWAYQVHGKDADWKALTPSG